MLEAKKLGFWRDRFVINVDGRPVAQWEGSIWRTGGTFELEGQRFEVRGNLWGSKYGMATTDGQRVATADRVGRKRWTVDAGGRTYHFRRPSVWRHDQELLLGDQPVGSIKRTSIWRSDAVADLPGLPLPVQLFVLAVVLSMWEQQDAAATSAG